MKWFKKKNTIDKLVIQLDALTYDDIDATEELYLLCQEEIVKNKDTIDLIFEKWFEIGDLFKKKPQKYALLLYKLTNFIQSHKYIPNYHKYQVNFIELSHIPIKYEKEFKNLLQTTLEIQDFMVIEKANFISQGNVGDIAATTFNIYNRCIANYTLVPELMGKLSQYVKPFVQKFPNNSDYTILNALENHSNPIKATAEILLILIDKKADDSLLEHILNDLVSPFRRDDFYYQSSFEIIAQLMQDWQSISDEKKNWFIEKLLADGLYINLKSQDDQLADASKLLDKLLQYPEKYKLGIDGRKKDLQELEINFEKIQQNNWKKAYKKVAVSSKVRKVLELVVKHDKNLPNIAYIQQLLQNALEFKDTPKLYNLNQKPSVVFSDLHFKLWIIEDLMYKQNLLVPKFKLEMLAEEYIAREINREDDGYEVIPEVKKYFKNLDIPKELLLKVETIEISYLSEVYDHLWPFCDAGCGDELLAVSNKMINDLALVPKLKKIVGLEELHPPKKLLKELEEKGIELVENTY